jgi:hypothetical protein
MGGPTFNATVSGNGDPGVRGTSIDGSGVQGTSSLGNGVEGTSGLRNGVEGTSTDGSGVVGTSTSGSGVVGESNGSGVMGISPSGIGVEGSSTDGIGVYGFSNTSAGVEGESTSNVGVRGFSTSGTGVDGQSTSHVGVHGQSTSGTGVEGVGGGTGVEGRGDEFGVFARSRRGDGVRAFGVETGAGVRGIAQAFGSDPIRPDKQGAGVEGISNVRGGISGVNGGVGVRGVHKGNGIGVEGQSESFNGVVGLSRTGAGVVGFGSPGGWFSTGCRVFGNLDVINGDKPFTIDHPLDPQNNYLLHASVESSERKNIYDGVVRLGKDGAVWVELPEWFEALNGDFRYQLTAIGSAAPNLHIAGEISENRFKIAGGEEGMKVCWQVTGSRRDPWAVANPFEVEREKGEEERGRYLDPSVYGAPEELRVLTVPTAPAVDEEQRAPEPSGIDLASQQDQTRK